MSLTSITGRLLLQFAPQGTYQYDALAIPSVSVTVQDYIDLTLGSTLGTQANKIYVATRTLTASGGATPADALNVSGGAHAGAIALTDPFGIAVTFSKIIGMIIKNTATTSATVLTVFSDAADDVSTMVEANGDGLRLRYGAAFALLCGSADATQYAVAADEVVTVTNLDAANGATYEVAILGS